MGFESPFAIEEVHDLPKDVPMRFNLDTKKIEVSPEAKYSKSIVLQHLVEEILHGIDSVRSRSTISASSKKFNRQTGIVTREALDHYESGGELAAFLKYPFHHKYKLSDTQTQAELFARLGVVYLGNPGLLKETLPNAYQVYHEIFGLEVESPTDSDRYVFRKVWQGGSAGNRKMGGEPGVSRPAGGEASGTDRQGGAGRGLDGIRAAIARASEGSRLGRLVEFWSLDTRYTPEQEAALKKGGFGNRSNKPFKEDFRERHHLLGTKLRQGIVDQYAAFKDILKDNRSWMMAQLTGSSNGALEAAIDYGEVFMNNGAVDVDVAKKSLKEILAPLGEELDDWLAWMAGNRADKLAEQDRERLFSSVDIDALKSLNQSNMKDGRRRSMVYSKVRKEFEAMNAAINQIGVDTGLINAKEAEAWKDQGFYVPFYRMMEEEGDVRGPKVSGGLIRQRAYKKLKGADIPLNDLMTNVLMNWSHILGTSLRNQAGVQALETAASPSMGLATEVSQAEASKKAIWVMKDGKKVFYELDDSQEGQLVLNAQMNLNWSGLNNFAMKFMRKMKRVFTMGVTSSPEFRIANLLRDSIHSIAVVDMSTNIAKNVANGWKATNKKSQTLARMIAGGGAFGDSGYIHGADPEAIKRLVGKGVGRETILTRNYLYKFWDKYQDFGARMENINRAAAFEKKLNKDGASLLEANFEARDLLDFSRTGAFEAVRALTQVVPFLNARLQGLDKMGRSVRNKKQRRQFMAVVGVNSIASVALYLAMRNDPDYDEAEDWERDAYHLFKLPGSDIMYRLPRPFEVGLIATLLEHAAEKYK